MFTFDEKFISIHNSQTHQHFIIKTQLYYQLISAPYPLYPNPSLLNSHSPPHSTSGECREKKQRMETDKQQCVDPAVKIQDNISSIKVVNLNFLFQKMGICGQERLRKQIYVPQLNRYCQLRQLCVNQNYLPVQYTKNQVIILRYCNDYHYSSGFNFFNKSSIFEKKSSISQPQRFKIQDIKQSDHIYSPQNQQKHSQVLSTPKKNKIQQSQQAERAERAEQAEQEDIKQRDRSRSIGEIMQYVRKWRYIAEEGINGMKLNLQQAAVYVGIPKKSLDDYFYQLRVGQKYNFDFETNLNKNISVLRKFVKQKVPSRNRDKDKQKGGGYSYDSAQSKKQQNNNLKNKAKASSATKLPKQLKSFIEQSSKQKVEAKRKISITLSDCYDYRSNRLSDSEASSIPNFWPNINSVNNKDGIFDEQDSFFNDFKCGNQKFLQYNHLLKNQEVDKSNRMSAKDDSLSENSLRNSLFEYGLGYCFFKKQNGNQSDENI